MRHLSLSRYIFPPFAKYTNAPYVCERGNTANGRVGVVSRAVLPQPRYHDLCKRTGGANAHPERNQSSRSMFESFNARVGSGAVHLQELGTIRAALNLG